MGFNQEKYGDLMFDGCLDLWMFEAMKLINSMNSS
jgi:hypothetical protein